MVKGELIAVCSYLMGGCRTRSSQTLAGNKREQHKLQLIFSMRMVRHWNGGTEGLWDLHPWRYSKINWTKPQAT